MKNSTAQSAEHTGKRSVRFKRFVFMSERRFNAKLADDWLASCLKSEFNTDIINMNQSEIDSGNDTKGNQ